MPIKNLLEEIVDNVVKEILKKEGEWDSLIAAKDDIVAYALNRIPPQYVTSERGILHGQIASKYKIQQKADIIIGVYEAIDIIKKRRGSVVSGDNLSVSPVFNMIQHIVGSVADEETLSPIFDTKVSLMFNGEMAKMIDSNWVNPYITNAATRGYYHFWPAYSHKKMNSADKLEFVIRFEHPDFEPATIEIELKIRQEHDPDDQLVKESFNVPMVLLKPKNASQT